MEKRSFLIISICLKEVLKHLQTFLQVKNITLTLESKGQGTKILHTLHHGQKKRKSLCTLWDFPFFFIVILIFISFFFFIYFY